MAHTVLLSAREVGNLTFKNRIVMPPMVIWAAAEDALSRGVADCIAVGRGQLADPGWARKVTLNQAETIEMCQNCKPKCFHFSEPSKCPACKNLRTRDEL